MGAQRGPERSRRKEYFTGGVRHGAQAALYLYWFSRSYEIDQGRKRFSRDEKLRIPLYLYRKSLDLAPQLVPPGYLTYQIKSSHVSRPDTRARKAEPFLVVLKEV